MFLTSREKEQLNTLIKLTESVDTLYIKLFELEENKEKETELYNKIFDFLDIATSVIKDKYTEYNFSKTTCEKYLNYLSNYLNINETIWNYLISQKFNERVYRRIILNLKKIINNKDNIYIEFKDSLSEYFESPNFSSTVNYISEEIYYNIIVQTEIQKDLIRAFLTYLDREINNPNNKYIRETLIDIKLNTIFLDDELENEYMLRKFSSMENVTLNSNFTAHRLHMSEDIYMLLCKAYTKDLIKSQINYFLKPNNNCYEDILVNMILRECILKACLTLLDTKSLKEVSNYFTNIYKDTWVNNKITLRQKNLVSLAECFKESKLERKKIKTNYNFLKKL